MTTYVTSDLHLDHENIIGYCERPFSDVDEMNATLVSNWNRVVGNDDTVIFLGDLAMWGEGAILDWADELNGQMLFVMGNHDTLDMNTAPFPVCESLTFSHGNIKFYCSHYPEEVPEDASWWHLYGHHHNNDLDAFPFISPHEQRLNLSTELTHYTPVSLDRIVECIQAGEKLATLPKQ